MTLPEFTKQLHTAVYVQLMQASLPIDKTVWKSETEFQVLANGFTLRFTCYYGDKSRICCMLTETRPGGRQKTYQLAHRKSYPIHNPKVVDALGTKLTIVELVS